MAKRDNVIDFAFDARLTDYRPSSVVDGIHLGPLGLGEPCWCGAVQSLSALAAGDGCLGWISRAPFLGAGFVGFRVPLVIKGNYTFDYLEPPKPRLF